MKRYGLFSIICLLGVAGTIAGCNENTVKETQEVDAKITAQTSVVEVGEQDVNAGFTVTITPKVDRDVTFSVTASGGNSEGYTLNESALTVKAGATTASGTVTFKASAFNSEGTILR